MTTGKTVKTRYIYSWTSVRTIRKSTISANYGIVMSNIRILPSSQPRWDYFWRRQLFFGCRNDVIHVKLVLHLRETQLYVFDFHIYASLCGKRVFLNLWTDLFNRGGGNDDEVSTFNWNSERYYNISFFIFPSIFPHVRTQTHSQTPYGGGGLYLLYT